MNRAIVWLLVCVLMMMACDKEKWEVSRSQRKMAGMYNMDCMARTPCCFTGPGQFSVDTSVYTAVWKLSCGDGTQMVLNDVVFDLWPDSTDRYLEVDYLYSPADLKLNSPDKIYYYASGPGHFSTITQCWGKKK